MVHKAAKTAFTLPLSSHRECGYRDVDTVPGPFHTVAIPCNANSESNPS